MRKCKGNFLILKYSNNAIEEPSPNLELEVSNLQCSDMLKKGKYQGSTVIKFYECHLKDEYAQLKLYACRLISIFGSICVKKHFHIIKDQY